MCTLALRRSPRQVLQPTPPAINKLPADGDHGGCLLCKIAAHGAAALASHALRNRAACSIVTLSRRYRYAPASSLSFRPHTPGPVAVRREAERSFLRPPCTLMRRCASPERSAHSQAVCHAIPFVTAHGAHCGAVHVTRVLAADSQELEEVVITASPIGDADALAIIAGSVDRNHLLRSGGGTIADALWTFPVSPPRHSPPAPAGR